MNIFLKTKMSACGVHVAGAFLCCADAAVFVSRCDASHLRCTLRSALWPGVSAAVVIVAESKVSAVGKWERNPEVTEVLA